MPDPVLFAKAMSAAGVACAALIAALLTWKKPAGALRTSVAHCLSLVLAMVVGCYVLSLTLHWPPQDGLDRLLLIVLPAVAAIELVAAATKPHWAVWLLRACLAAVAGRILLHNSSLLEGTATGWSAAQVRFTLAASAVLLVAVWWLHARLADRSPGISTVLVVSAVSVAGAWPYAFGLCVRRTGGAAVGGRSGCTGHRTARPQNGNARSCRPGNRSHRSLRHSDAGRVLRRIAGQPGDSAISFTAGRMDQ
ncbi:MAG: hypothetical protein HY290_31240 [Planctomycetia bacterium]|nr:hypothetical protein [Planctomycetia bacterium]